LNYFTSDSWPDNTYLYVESSGGLVTDASYSYQSYNGATGECPTQLPAAPVTAISGAFSVDTEEAMMEYVLSTGPLQILIDATVLFTYVGGIITNCTSDLNHAVQIVGVTITNDSATSYFKVN